MNRYFLLAFLGAISLTSINTAEARTSRYDKCVKSYLHLEKKRSESYEDHTRRIIEQCDKALEGETNSYRLGTIHDARASMYWVEAYRMDAATQSDERRRQMEKSLAEYNLALDYYPKQYFATERKIEILSELYGDTRVVDYKIELALQAAAGIVPVPTNPSHPKRDHDSLVLDLMKAELNQEQWRQWLDGYTALGK